MSMAGLMETLTVAPRQSGVFNHANVGKFYIGSLTGCCDHPQAIVIHDSMLEA
jgi:hypothetical protein